jgi:hypothetical protein
LICIRMGFDVVNPDAVSPIKEITDMDRGEPDLK